LPDRLRQLVLAFLKVPPEPELPEGSSESMLTFRPGRNFYRWQVLMWCLSHIVVVTGVTLAYSVVWIPVTRGPRWLSLLYAAIGIVGSVVVATVLLVTFLALRWSFELRWYILSDRSLRIRRGVWNVEELTMTFANIQEVRVNAGPIQKALGIADLEVHAAGGGAAIHHSHSHGREAGHAAIFEGVDNTTEIRDRIVERLRVYRDSGLGGEHSPQETVDSADVTLAAARDALDATRSLREVLQPSTR
jgi:membrane protein YdbS with pleckstrin-like domain